MGVERKHTLILKIGSDSVRDLANHLNNIAFDLSRHEEDRENLTGEYPSVSGGYASGHVMLHRVNADQTHDAYFAELERELDAIHEREKAGAESGNM